jgi:integration host factor subunit beta
MNKSDLIGVLARQVELPLPKVQEIVNTVFHTMAEALASGDRIEIRGLGSFLR